MCENPHLVGLPAQTLIRSKIYTHILPVEQKRSNLHINAVEHAHSISDCMRLRQKKTHALVGLVGH